MAVEEMELAWHGVGHQGATVGPIAVCGAAATSDAVRRSWI